MMLMKRNMVSKYLFSDLFGGITMWRRLYRLRKNPFVLPPSALIRISTTPSLGAPPLLI
jgi:hypothetical protein